MKRTIPHIAFALLFLPAALVAAGPADIPLERVIITNPGAVEEQALRALLPDTMRGDSGRDTLDKVQGKLHAERGYFASRLTRYEPEGESGETNLRVRLESGPLSRIGNAALEETAALPAEPWRELSGPFRGRPAASSQVNALLEQTALACAERGYPFCRVLLRKAELDSSGNLNLYLRLEPGNLRMLGNIRFPGLENTRESVALRLAGLRPGEFYNETRVRQARGRMMRSGLFRRVEDPVVSGGPGPFLADLGYAVEESRSNSLLAALGSGGPAGSSTLSGVFRLEMNNLMGSARRAGVRWERPRRDWSELELSWREPWLMGSGISLDVSYRQQLRDSLYTASSGSLGISLQPGDYVNLGLGLVLERVSPGSETWELAQASRLWALEGSVERSDLLNPGNPTRGSRLLARARAGRRKISLTSLREVRADLALDLFMPLVHAPHIAALSAGYSFVSRGTSGVAELPYHARIPVGGSTAGGGIAVRGHQDEELRARRAGRLSLEYRYLTGPASRLLLFYDLCAAQAPAAPERLGTAPAVGWKVRTLQGYGAGIQLESRLGLLSLDLALQPGRGPGDARLHVSLRESF